MHITPLDIQQKRFRESWRGLDKSEVDSFLNLVAAEFEKLMTEMNLLRENERRQARLLETFHEREQALKETMLTAQRVTEEITVNARKEADIIIGRAELEAEKIVESAQERLTELLQEIAELKRQRVMFMQQIRGVVETHVKLLEIADESDGQPKIEENLAVMKRPRRVVIPPASEDDGSKDKPRQLRS